MESNKEFSYFIEILEKQSQRIDNIEQLLKLLLVNNVLNDIDRLHLVEEYQLDEEMKEFILQQGLSVGEFKVQNGIRVLNINVPEGCKISVSKIIALRRTFVSSYPELVVCFNFITLHGAQRKRLLEEQIAFCVKNKEIHLFQNKRK